MAAKATNPATAATPFDAFANPKAIEVANNSPRLAKMILPIDCKIVKNWNAPFPQSFVLAAAANPPPTPKKIPAIGKIAIGKTIARAKFCNLVYDVPLNLFQPLPNFELSNLSLRANLAALRFSICCCFSVEITLSPIIVHPLC